MDNDYDIVIVGGGLGGAALGGTLARHGIRVLVLEREAAFRDRVRGEYMHPWGVAEAQALDLYKLLKQTCGHEARYRRSWIAGLPPIPLRDFVETSPHHVGSLHFYHPEMQEVILGAAMQAGAVVRRGLAAVDVLPGPGVRVRTDEGEVTYRARLVVGADGRTSACRKWAGFETQHDPDRMVIAGVLMDGLSAPEDSNNTFAHPARSQFAFTVPLGRTRFRCYAGYYQQPGRRRLSGGKALAEFIADSIATGMPAEWFASAQAAGPLASFDCAETWVPHPYRAGVILIGDAAGVSDPTFGCGLSLVLRDVRVLSNLLLTETDWDAAAHAYAEEHDRYFGSIHRQCNWMVELLYEPGPVAAERRERAFARLAEDSSRGPDIAGLGPESPSDDAAYQNLFGEN
jgi:2-polyprenyl-6-methoxyphenol hydroxylase-like FAD-dependent oxidoreductase